LPKCEPPLVIEQVVSDVYEL